MLGFPLDEGRSEVFDSCVLFGVSRGLVLDFSLLLTTGAAGLCMTGRFPVLRFRAKQLDSFQFRRKGINLDAIILDDSVLFPYNQGILAIILGRYCSVAFGQNLEVLATLD